MGAMDYDLIINYEIFTDELEWLLVKSIIAIGAMKFVIKMRFDWFTHPCILNIEQPWVRFIAMGAMEYDLIIDYDNLGYELRIDCLLLWMLCIMTS